MKIILRIFIILNLIVNCQSSNSKTMSEIDEIKIEELKGYEFDNINLCPALGDLDKSKFKNAYILFKRYYKESFIEDEKLKNIQNKFEGIKMLEKSRGYSFGNPSYNVATLIINPNSLKFFDAKTIDNIEDLKNFLILYNYLCDYSPEIKPNYYNDIVYVKELNTKIGFLQKSNSDSRVLIQSDEYPKFMVSKFYDKKGIIRNSRNVNFCGLAKNSYHSLYCHGSTELIKNDFEINRALIKILDSYRNVNLLTSISLLDVEKHGKYDFNSNYYQLDINKFFLFSDAIDPLDKSITFPDVKLKISKEMIENLMNIKSTSIRFSLKIDYIKDFQENSKKCIEGLGGKYCNTLGICDKCFKYKNEKYTVRRMKLSLSELIIMDSNHNVLFKI